MKNLVKILLLIILSYSLVYANDSPNGYYKIDLKTKFKNKADLKSAKHGLKAILEGKSWCEVKETGEDFAVWIISPNRYEEILDNGNKKISFTCLLEIREKSMFRKGDLIANKEIKFEYEIDKSELSKFDDPNYTNPVSFVESMINNSKDQNQSKELKSLAMLTVPQVYLAKELTQKSLTSTFKMFEPYLDISDPIEYKAEFYFIGGHLYKELVDMIKKLESK